MRRLAAFGLLLAPVLATGCVSCVGMSASWVEPGLNEALVARLPLDGVSRAPVERGLPFDPLAAGFPASMGPASLYDVRFRPESAPGAEVWMTGHGHGRVVLTVKERPITDDEAVAIVSSFMDEVGLRDDRIREILLADLVASRADFEYQDTHHFEVDLAPVPDLTELRHRLAGGAPPRFEDGWAETLGEWSFRYRLAPLVLEIPNGPAPRTTISVTFEDRVSFDHPGRDVSPENATQLRAAVEARFRELDLAPPTFGSFSVRESGCVG